MRHMPRKRHSYMFKTKKTPEKQLKYWPFQHLFKILDINPIEFKKHSGDNVIGYFPDFPERKSNIDIKKLAKVMWKDS